MKILGVRFGHDSSAALVIDGEIVADVAEERFSRVKNDCSFPIRSIEYCLQRGGIDSEQLDVLAIPASQLHPTFGVFFEIPEDELKRQRRFKSWVKSLLYEFTGASDKLPTLPLYRTPFRLKPDVSVELVDHHLSHISSAAFTSGIALSERVLGITADGIGDGTSVAVWRIENNRIENLVRYGSEASLAWFYANSTEAMGWRHGSEEWKVMGLAPYGTPKPGLLKGFHPEFADGELSRPHQYGEFGTWLDHGGVHFHGADSLPMSKIFSEVGPETFAAEVQRVSEEQAFNLVLPWLEKEQTRHLVCAGGFFLNVKFNQKLWYTGQLDTQWVYPNPGDAGLAVGAALNVHYRENSAVQHAPLRTLYTGPEYSNEEIEQILKDRGIDYSYEENVERVAARHLSRNLVLGWFQGRMEAGPRALGNRSILMSPIDPGNKDRINAKVKYREAFRPFCPSILDEMYREYLSDPRDEYFMVTSFEVNPNIADQIPAVVHKDNSARPQIVQQQNNPRYHKLLCEFREITGEGAILNTSFNIKGEPIVCNPREAIKCFYDTGLDVLVLGNFVVRKGNVDAV